MNIFSRFSSKDEALFSNPVRVWFRPGAHNSIAAPGRLLERWRKVVIWEYLKRF